MMGALVMEKAGLKQGDVQMTALGSLSGALTALENGVVDATSIPVILFRTRGGESKYRVLVGPKDLPLIPSQLGMATGKAMTEWPEKLRAIQAARRDGTKFIYEHTDEAIEILSKLYAPLPPKDVGIMVRQLVEAKFWSEGRIEMPLLAQTVHAMKGVGMLQKDVDLKKVVDSSFLPPDLQLKRGEFFAVVGRSGCGTSTLLEVLAGLQQPSAGTVTFEGRAVAGKVPDGVGVVFQEDASFPWMTVWDNAAFGLRRNGVAAAEIRRRVDDALAFMGLTEFAPAYPAQLSGGMRQRVCISRTLVLQPRLILLDEPFGALDAQTRLLMGDEVLRLWRRTGATILLITHALDEAAMLSDRIGAMSARPGRFLDIVVTGWPRERDSKIVSEAGFGEITGRLWDNLRGESMKSLGYSGMAAE